MSGTKWTDEQVEAALADWKQAVELAFRSRSVERTDVGDGAIELKIKLDPNLLQMMRAHPAA